MTTTKKFPCIFYVFISCVPSLARYEVVSICTNIILKNKTLIFFVLFLFLIRVIVTCIDAFETTQFMS